MTIKAILSRFADKAAKHLQSQTSLRHEYDNIKRRVELITPGNPAIYGYKIYSQCDEDGILAYIFSKISGLRTFVEIGCGNGLENNTHGLILSGWRGIWIDGNRNNIKHIQRTIPISKNLIYKCVMVSEENVVQVIKGLTVEADIRSIDLLSIDIDSNEIYILEELLKHITPRVLCVEYNAKFPPPMEISVRHNATMWRGDDYQGSSLSSFVKILDPFGYKLITCNLSGVNAFFVRKEYAKEFPNYNAVELYQPARYDLIRLKSGHRPSLRFLADALSSPYNSKHE